MSYADIDLAMVPAAPPARKKQRGTPLPGPDLRHSAVPAGIEVDPKCLLQRVHGSVHPARTPIWWGEQRVAAVRRSVSLQTGGADTGSRNRNTVETLFSPEC